MVANGTAIKFNERYLPKQPASHLSRPDSYREARGACPPTGGSRSKPGMPCPESEAIREHSFCKGPANLKIVIGAVICPEPEVTVVFRSLSWLSATMILSRWLAKTVTSELTLLTVLATGLIYLVGR
jgi:hypothetical protein